MHCPIPKTNHSYRSTPSQHATEIEFVENIEKAGWIYRLMEKPTRLCARLTLAGLARITG